MSSIRHLFAAVLLLGVTGNLLASDDLPRYQFQVGQKIIYVVKAESRYKDDKHTFNSDDETEWSLWVVRKNPDGSWRIVLQSKKSMARLGPVNGRRASPAETAMGYLEIHPDGRIVPNRSIGYHFDPLRLFPPLPPDARAAEHGWEDRRDRDVSVRHYTPSAASQSGFAFKESYDSPMSRISLTTTEANNLVDKGILQRYEARKSRKYGITGSETETCELKSVEMVEGVDQFAQEASLFFDALAAYWDLEDRTVIDKSRHGKAEAVLAAIRDKLTIPPLCEQADAQLARHRSMGSYGLQRADELAQLLGKPGPDWEAKDIDGKTHMLKDYRGKVVLLDFWDRGCGWCIRAMPQLEAIAEEFKGQPVQLLGMNLDSEEKDARLVIEQMGITYPTVRAIGLTDGYRIAGIPHLVILDKEGKIADIHIGYAPTLKERVSQSVRELLDKK